MDDEKNQLDKFTDELLKVIANFNSPAYCIRSEGALFKQMSNIQAVNEEYAQKICDQRNEIQRLESRISDYESTNCALQERFTRAESVINQLNKMVATYRETQKVLQAKIDCESTEREQLDKRIREQRHQLQALNKQVNAQKLEIWKLNHCGGCGTLSENNPCSMRCEDCLIKYAEARGYRYQSSPPQFVHGEILALETRVRELQDDVHAWKKIAAEGSNNLNSKISRLERRILTARELLKKDPYNHHAVVAAREVLSVAED